MIRCLGWLDQLLRQLLIGLMAAIVLVVCWQVLSRFVLASPSSITEELSRCLLLWIGMLGAALAYRTGQHLGLDLVVRQCSKAWQRRIALLLTALVLLFAFAVMVLGGSALVQLAFVLDQQSAALDINVGWIYLVIPLAGGLICVFACCQLVALWRGDTLPSLGGLD